MVVGLAFQPLYELQGTELHRRMKNGFGKWQLKKKKNICPDLASLIRVKLNGNSEIWDARNMYIELHHHRLKL